jgi:capsular polysaccharide transport system permease protein
VAASRTLRSPLTVTLAVWKALFLREAISRLAQDRIAWALLIVEPLFHVVLLMWVFSVGFRQRVLAGGDVGVFIMLGILGFFLVRNIMNRAMDAIDASEALFAFRQVKPVDTVLVRAVLEGLLVFVLFLVMFAGGGVLEYPIYPADLLGALQALGALWLAGLGLGLVLSVLGNLVAEFGRMVRLLFTPLYFFSAVIYPTVVLPLAIRDVLLLNPIVHGLESLRVAFMPAYRVPPGIDLGYLVAFAVVMIFMGLAMHIHFKSKLMTT